MYYSRTEFVNQPFNKQLVLVKEDVWDQSKDCAALKYVIVHLVYQRGASENENQEHEDQEYDENDAG